MYKVKKLLGLKKVNNFADNYIFFCFVWSEESSEYFGLEVVIPFDILISFWNMTREDRLITLTIKIWEFTLSVRAK